MRPRLLIVAQSLDMGGTERHIAEIAPRLQTRGFEIAVALLRRRGALADAVEAQGVRLVTGRLRLLLHMLLARPAIVHTFLPEPYLTGGLLALALGVPIRIMSRRSQNAYQRRRPRLAGIERWLHGRMSFILANSERVRQELLAEGVRPDRLLLLHNGVDLARFAAPCDRATVRAGIGVSGDALVLAIVANLIAYKGHADLIAALAGIGGRLPEGWRLLVIGRDDGIGPDLRRAAERAGIASNLVWLGQRNDVAELLSACDIGLLVSHEEGFSNALIEGMAAGLPMVVTDVGGNAEAVGAVAGVVVPPSSPEQLGEAILGLASDPERARALGKAGRIRAAEHYSIEACTDAYAALYRQCLATA